VLAVAFNKRISDDLQEALPPQFVVKTLNGLGHGAWMKQRGRRVELDKQKLTRLVSTVFQDLPHLKEEEEGTCWAAVRRFSSLLRHNGYVPENTANRPIWRGMDEVGALDALEDFRIVEGWNEDFMSPDDMMEICDRVLRLAIDEAFRCLIDFDDQIYMTTCFFCPYPHFDVVLVDEAQDLSPLNHRQLLLCKPRQLIAVGDRRQAIYAFRGADSQSMDNLITKAATQNIFFHEYQLNTSFRCPQQIVARQHAHYPEFKAAPTNREGTVKQLPIWDASIFPKTSTAIICRNNAPLVSMAFTLLRNKRGFTFFGQDMGKNLKSLIKKIAGKSGKTLNKADEAMKVDEILTRLSLWFEAEKSKLSSKPELLAGLTDRKECCKMILMECKTLGEAMLACDTIFEQAGDLVLTSGHRSKGFEWNHVFHLDYFRIPSKWAREAAAQGIHTPMRQEINLKYVIETRTKDTLTMIRLEDNLDVYVPEKEEE
jgi:hypothetical protein